MPSLARSGPRGLVMDAFHRETRYNLLPGRRSLIANCLSKAANRETTPGSDGRPLHMESRHEVSPKECAPQSAPPATTGRTQGPVARLSQMPLSRICASAQKLGMALPNTLQASRIAYIIPTSCLREHLRHLRNLDTTIALALDVPRSLPPILLSASLSSRAPVRLYQRAPPPQLAKFVPRCLPPLL